MRVCNAKHCVGAKVIIIIDNIKDLVETDSILTWKDLLGTVMNFQGEKSRKYKICTKFKK